MQIQKEMIRNTTSTYMCGSLEAEGVTVAGKGTPSLLPSSSPPLLIWIENHIWTNYKIYLLQLVCWNIFYIFHICRQFFIFVCKFKRNHQLLYWSAYLKGHFELSLFRTALEWPKTCKRGWIKWAKKKMASGKSDQSERQRTVELASGACHKYQVKIIFLIKLHFC